jgi:hypothetical protein
MKNATVAAVAALLLMSSAAAVAESGPRIQGLYVESRTCDVFTGPCVANGEVGLTGHEAVLVWKVAEGAWDGSDLSGLAVVAAVRAAATLGDTYSDPYPAKSVVLVDERADAAQRAALVALARELAGELLAEVVEVHAVPIEAEIGACTKSGCASVTAGEMAAIQTRCLGEGDHLCGNETAFYPPLTPVDGAVPAYVTQGMYKGNGLNATWDERGRRSAFIASFAL